MPATSRTKRLTRERVRRLRERRKAENLQELRGVFLPGEIKAKLELVTLLSPSQSVSSVVQSAVRNHVEARAEQAEKLLRLVAIYWPKIREYEPYLDRLVSPTSPPIVVHNRRYTYAEAKTCFEVYGELKRQFTKLGVRDVRAAIEGVYRTVKMYKMLPTNHVPDRPISS